MRSDLHNEDSKLVTSLIRFDGWWSAKVGVALAVAYCSSLVFDVSAGPTIRSILMVAFVGLCAGAYGHMLNDIFDQEADRRAGKRNRMAVFSPGRQFLFCAIALGFGFAPALVVSCSRTTLLLLGLEYFLLTVYSLPPIRIKERGVFGLLCDALGAHAIPCLYVISILAHERSRGANSTAKVEAFVVLAGLWALFLGLNGITVHQFQDRENDRRSRVNTFATQSSFARAVIPLSVLYGCELLAFSGLCGVVQGVAPLLWMLAILYGAMLGLKIWGHWQHYRNFSRESIVIEWWQFSHPYYEAYFPLAVALECAWVHPQLTPFALLQFGVAVPTFRSQLRDVRHAFWHFISKVHLRDTRLVVRTSERPIAHPAKFLWGMLRDIAACRHVAWQLMRRDLNSQYRTSIFGVLIPLLPALATAAWAILFRDAHLIEVGTINMPYPFFVLCGMMLWASFVESMDAPISGLHAEHALLSKANVPAEAITMARLGQVLVNLGVKAILILIAAFIYRVHVSWTIVFVPFGLALIISLGTAIGLIVGPISLIYTDVTRILPIVTTFWFFTTPIIFTAPTRGWAAILMSRVNPMTPLLTSTRELAFGGRVSMLSGLEAATVFTLLLLAAGVIFHRIAMPVVIDRANA